MTPDNLLAIFRTEHFTVRVHPWVQSANNGGVDYLKLTVLPPRGEVGHWGSGLSCGVRMLEMANSSTDPGAFPSWICDYANDAVNYRTLSNARSFCFTATMNGCTFGIGSQVGGGVVTVSHSNALTAGGGDLTKQVNEQMVLASMVSPQGASLFEPKAYGFAGGQSIYVRNGTPGQLDTTTFGVCVNNFWTFYYQQYIRCGSQYLLKTFKAIDTNSLRVVISD